MVILFWLTVFPLLVLIVLFVRFPEIRQQQGKIGALNKIRELEHNGHEVQFSGRKYRGIAAGQ